MIQLLQKRCRCGKVLMADQVKHCSLECHNKRSTRAPTAAAIGRTVRIRIDPNTSVVGRVVTCTLTSEMKFRVVVMAGKDNKYQHTHDVFELPSYYYNDGIPELRACNFNDDDKVDWLSRKKRKKE